MASLFGFCSNISIIWPFKVLDKTGPAQSKTGLIVKSKTLRKTQLFCKVFGISGFPRDFKATTVF